jgi:hypothetical protein
MNNKPVAWMFRGYLYEKDPNDWTVHEHPNVPVIPLYTHPAKTLSKDELKIMWQAAMSKADKEEDGEAYEFFANAILKKASEK